MYRILSDFELIALFRLTMSVLIGAIIGYDRSRRGSPAGIKTHALVCLGSTLVMIVSLYINEMFSIKDISRLPAQVISGIGFLGAGTILVTGKSQIKGLTSAAGIWFSACAGLAIGLGFYAGSIYATLLATIGVELLSRLSLKKGESHIELFLENDDKFNLSTLIRVLHDNNCKLTEVDSMSFENYDEDHIKNSIVAIKKSNQISTTKLIEKIKEIEGVIIITKI